MLDEGGLNLAVRLVDQGYRGIVLRQLLARAFPNGLDNSIIALARYAREERADVAAAQLAGFNDELRSRTTRANANIPKGVRYAVLFNYVVGHVLTRGRYIEIDQSAPVSKAALTAMIDSILAGETRLDFTRKYPVLLHAERAGPITVIAIERGSA